ncbi:HEAT repeat domain-containing protein [Lentzea alba]|uniref:HEAT repeat domain-containing protein n=1 Tax=Lentzea alba TaxID=2714351 RepID=UPI0039BF3250
MITDEERQALEQLRSGTKEERAAAAAELARGSGHDVDIALLKMFRASADEVLAMGTPVRQRMRSGGHAELISRVLAERDPDRDPAYIERMFLYGFDEEQKDGGLVGAEEWGFTRLRRLEPVQWYAKQLQYEGFARWMMRAAAVVALGDTSDPAAFDVLLPVLSHESKRVRGAAVQAVLRLARSGLDDEYRAHPVHQRLAEMLSDHPKVRVEAARALCRLGDEALVAEALSKAPWWQRKWRRELETCLRGEIPPLPKMWPGDQNV